METADVIVIGSGQGGIPLAADLAKEGRKVVLFERDALGGSCINYGCTPSKAFLAAAHAVGRAKKAEGLGIRVSVDVDFPAVMERVRSIRNSFNQGVTKRLQSAGVKVVCAEASFTGDRTVTGGEVTLQAPLVVINTGTSSLIPEIPGLTGTPYLTNRNFFDIQELPPRLLVMGGGYIGLELGQGLARLGSETHIIVRGDRLLDREESDVSETLAEALKEDGIGVHFHAKVEKVVHDGVFTVTLSNGEQLQGEALLVDRVLGYATYTEPQVGRVGMTLEQAQKQGIKARAVTLPMNQIARAIEWDHKLGFYRMVVDEDTDKILGATLVGYETAELVHVFLSLMEAQATWQLLEQSVHIHPTYGEALPSLARLLIGEDMPGCPNK